MADLVGTPVPWRHGALDAEIPGATITPQERTAAGRDGTPAQDRDAGPCEGHSDAGPIRFRRAGAADQDQLARLHHTCSQHQPGGFMHRLGVSFFRSYYRILMPDPNTIVISAEDASGRILGFVAGCRDAQVEMDRLRSHRMRLLLSCLPHILRTPQLIRELYTRRNYFDGSQPDPWGAGGESRISFWCWEPGSATSRQSTLLLRHYLDYLRKAGVRAVRFEVDRINRKVEITHRLMGAKTLRTVRMPDGRERLVMEHTLV